MAHVFGGPLGGGGWGAVAADGPRLHDVHHGVDFGPGGVRLGIGGEGGPAGGGTAHVGDAVARFRRAELEPDDEVQCFLGVGGRMAGTVAQTHAPDGEDGFAVVALVVGVRSDFEFVDEVLPIVFECLGEGGGIAAGDIVFDGEGAAGFAGCGHDVFEYDIAAGAFAASFADEALDENAVEAVLLHPAEVAADGFGIAGGEEEGGFVADGHAGDGAEFVGGELG